MKNIFITLLLSLFSIGLFADVDTASFFDIKGKCNYNNYQNLNKISGAYIDKTVQGMLGNIEPQGNQINRFNLDGQQY